MTRLAIKLGVMATTALAVAACATSVPPAPPVLAAPEGPCDTTVSLDAAVAIGVPENPRRPESGYIAFTQGDAEEDIAPTPCWTNPDTGTNTPYGVYALPDIDGNVVVTAAAPLTEIFRAVALDVRTLDADGNVVRHLDRDDFEFRTEGYAARLRPRDNEAYILVSVEPELVGEGFDRVFMGTNTTTVATAYGASSITTGADTVNSRRFSYAGSTMVKVQIFE